ncbi:hypothetical protein QA601_13340 [Chitinispirillales bacterium ANBcel5]|uniref:hypothetical protein n=1 Tax=Cellulosispirillum alkaliphilum TaxID=3039283 RepID=UPI002A4F6366|nr:hypothetical protein [Chitinispirillales bacterium ANBcel5]
MAIFAICVSVSIVLMVLFVFINHPYYKLTYGQKASRIITRTLLLNSAALLIGWAPVVHFWPTFSLRYLLPFASIIGALGCVGSRFIYHELIPEELARRLLELVEEKSKERV